jgi:catechol 2,3-dioxygenase-like lactoylglutathione lyase family enzyme
MEPIEVLGLEHIDLTVNDLARSVIFYDKVMPALGFRRLPDNDRDNLRWANPYLTFAIRPAAESARGIQSLPGGISSSRPEGQEPRRDR